MPRGAGSTERWGRYSRTPGDGQGTENPGAPCQRKPGGMPGPRARWSGARGQDADGSRAGSRPEVLTSEVSFPVWTSGSGWGLQSRNTTPRETMQGGDGGCHLPSHLNPLLCLGLSPRPLWAAMRTWSTGDPAGPAHPWTTEDLSHSGAEVTHGVLPSGTSRETLRHQT